MASFPELRDFAVHLFSLKCGGGGTTLFFLQIQEDSEFPPSSIIDCLKKNADINQKKFLSFDYHFSTTFSNSNKACPTNLAKLEKMWNVLWF